MPRVRVKKLHRQPGRSESPIPCSYVLESRATLPAPELKSFWPPVASRYPVAQAAALQPSAADWPEVWGCSRDADCRFNGVCDSSSRACRCDSAWHGPTCASLCATLGRPRTRMACVF